MSNPIESHLHENRVFKPSAEFSSKARISSMEQYEALYKESIDHPDVFWGREASELSWNKKWDSVLNGKNPQTTWFNGATTNMCVNCVDRHVLAGRGDKTALVCEGEPGDVNILTYQALQDQVCQMANVLEEKGVQALDRVLIYMPMVAEATIAMLACARIGAVHSVVFGGFSSEAIKDRLEDSKAIFVITADGGWRRGKEIDLKKNIDIALEDNDRVEHVLVLQRTKHSISMKKGRDIWWHEAIENMSLEHDPTFFESEHPLFILYTSGSTGKPKGILHTTGGYMVNAYTTCKYIFDMKEEDVYWCTADVGWITGHSYITYGPLLNGVTQVMYEGAPNMPDFSRFWNLIEKYKVSIFYTAPTAIRAFIKAGDSFVDNHDLSSLRLLGSVGEPINEEAWMWYYEKIGGGRCPIVDTWWQTETGAIMISPLPGCTPLKPGTATRPFFGVDAVILDEDGVECPPNEGGKLVIQKPWPGMLRTIYGDEQRYKDTYWSDYPGMYTAGDGALRDDDGNIWIVGRLDDVLNVSGHRLGTAEIENALDAHEDVAEAAVIGKPHEIKGQAVVAFVSLKDGVEGDDELVQMLRGQVGNMIGSIAKPDMIYITPSLPKTRSGKIMRRLLKELVTTGKVTGNMTTLEDIQVVKDLETLVKK